MANRNWCSGGKIYSMHVSPVLLDCNFIVDSTNGNGLGQRSLKGPCITQVYMNTSATPASTINPAPGVIDVRLSDNYNRYLSGFSGFISPVGSSQTNIVANTAYVITSLGTATPAQWTAAGVPARYYTTNGLPNVGYAFVASVTTTIGGGATVAPSSTSGAGIDHIEVLGDPNQAMAPLDGQGGHLVLQCFKNGVLTAPANGSVVSLSFYFNNSSIVVQGE